MVAIISSSGLGLFGSSVSALGGGGASGNAGVGRGNDRFYVNTATGNLIVQSQDEVLRALGLDLALVRTYNSQGLLDDDNGDNWRLGIHQRVQGLTGTLNSAGTITKVFGDGRAVVYTYDSARGLYVSTEGDGAHDTLSNSAGIWTWTDGSSRNTETYNSAGQLTQSRDADGNLVSYTYTNSLLTQIVDASGQTTHLDYNTGGTNLTQIRVVSNSQTQTLTRYTYDGSNRLSQVTVDLTPQNTADNVVYTTTYTYDGTSRRIASVTQSDGSSISFTYQLIDSQYRVSTYTDAEGRLTRLTYPTATPGQTEVTDALGRVTTYRHDAQGRLTGVASPLVGASRLESSYAYDTAGNVISINEDLSSNRITTFAYDASGNLLSSRDSLGNTVTRTYNSNNQLLTETRYVVPDPDAGGSGQPSVPLTARYVYDGENHLRFVISAEGRVTEHRYASNTATNNRDGLRVSTFVYAAAVYPLTGLAPADALSEAQLVTWIGNQNKQLLERADYAYDFRGNLSTLTRYLQTDSAGAGTGTPSITKFVYDQRGQLLQTLEARGSAGTPNAATPNLPYATTYTYDGLGRVLSTTQWNSGTSLTTTLNSYDDANRRTTTTLANGLVTTRTYNRAGDLISVANGTAAATSQFGTTTQAYDANGQLRIVTSPSGVRQFYLYDEAGRKVAHVDGDGTLTELIYSGASQLIKTVQYGALIDSATLASLVDTNGNPTNVTLGTLRTAASGNAAQDRITRNVYDNAGRLVYAIDEIGAVTHFIYDGAGRVTDEVRYARAVTIARTVDLLTPADVVITTNTDDRRTRHFYDADGKLLGTLDGERYLIEYRYDAAGRLIEQIGWANRVTSATWATDALSVLRPAADEETSTDSERDIHSYFFYDGQGRKIGVLDGESYLTETVYDVAGNVAQTLRYDRVLTYTAGTSTFQTLKTAATGAPTQTTSYQYDGAGRVTQETNHEGTVTSYGYDSVGQLVSTTRALGTTEARTTETRYDFLGRVVQELTAEGRAQIAAITNPTQAQIDDIWNRFGVTYTYDVAGRRISATVRPNDAQTNTTLYFYDNDDRLRFEVNALGERKEYRYNSLNQLTDEIAYVNRIATTGLTGGLLTSALITTLTASADSARDNRKTYQYTLAGRVLSERVTRTATNAEDALTTYGYNAFGEQSSSTQQIDATRTLRTDYTYDHRGLLTQTAAGPTGSNAIEGRTYDAFGRLTRTTDARGKNWSTSYDRLGRVISSTDPGSPARLTTYDAFDRVLTRTDELGSTTTYVYDTANRRVTITSPEGVVTSSVHNRHGETVTLTDGRGNTTTYGYDANGRLKTVTTAAGTMTQNYDRAGQNIETIDANGIRTAYTYDAAGRMLTRTVDPTGLNLTTKTFYDGRGQAVWQQDANGVWTQMQYNRGGELVSIIVDPLNVPNTTSTQTAITLAANATGLNLRTDYTYDYRSQTLTVTEGVGSSQPRVMKYTYDVLGRRTEEAIDPNGLNLRTIYTYDLNGNVVAKTDAIGAVTRYVYNDKNDLVYAVDGTGAVIKTDYDATGRVIQITAYANRISLTAPSALPLTIAATDITARLTLNATADQVTRTVYDRDGRVRYHIDAMNAVTALSYDAAGNVVQTTRYATPITVPSTVNVTTIANAIATNAKDQTGRTVYDAANRATFTIDAEGYVTQYAYDAEGRVIKQIEYTDALAGTFATNVAPQIVSAAPSSGSYVLINAAGDRTTRKVYDAAGRTRFTVDGEGYVTELRYDAMGRQTRQIQYAAQYTVADGATVATVTGQVPATPGATEPVEQRIYDAAGRLVRTIDAENNTTLHVYDPVGRETDTTVAHGTVDASTTHRVFNAAGYLLDEITGYGKPEAATTRYVVDGVGNRTKILDPRGTELAETDTAWAKAMRLARNYPELAAGLTLAQRAELRAFYTTSQQFDANGRVTVLTDPFAKTITTEYDAFGNAVKITDQRGNSGYFYFDKENRGVLQVDPEGYVTQTVYNAFGTVDRIVRYANKVVGTVATNSPPVIVTAVPNPVTGPYVLVDSVRDQTTAIEHDRRDLQTRITDAESNFETMAYDAFGNKTSYRNKLGSIYTYAFYRTGKVRTETSPSVSVAVVDAAGNLTTSARTLITTYTYDARGNVRTISEAAAGQPPQERLTTITYDRLNRETRRDLPAITVFNGTTSSTEMPYTTTTYDRRGNIVEVRDTAGGRTISYYDALDRKVASVDGTGALSEYTYDDAGNLTLERTYSTRLNIANVVRTTRPTAVTGDTYREMEYVYDANNRQTKTLTQSETYFDPRQLATLSNGNTAVTGSGYVTGRIATYSDYDATGNVVRTIDGRGFVTLHFHDRLGQRTLTVDPLGYVTRFEYDGNGNVIRQWRYEQKLSNATIAALTPASNPQTIFTEVAGIGQDRVTEYEYDRLGRKKVERLLSVRYSTVSETGVLSSFEQSIQSSFLYDAAGNLKQTIAADGSQTNYDYDALGRLFRQQDPSSVVYNGMSGSTVLTTTVRATTEWQYDAFGNRTVQTRLGLAAAANQVTRTRYDVQGNAINEWDAMGARTDYDVDAAGRIRRQSKAATDVDSVAHTYRTYFTYDALNRELSRRIATDEGTANAIAGDTTWSSYNAFGDVSARGINSTTQVEYRYDKRGNLFWTNADTGTPRVYVYDASGNAVIEVSQANGTSLSSLTSPSAVQGIDPAQVQMKFSIYDGRNQITDVFQAPMDFTGLTGALSVQQTQQVANSGSSDPGTMRMNPRDEQTYYDSGYQLTHSYTASSGYVWSPSSQPYTESSSGAELDETAVSRGVHNQDPIGLGESTTGPTTYVDSPTQTRIVTVYRYARRDGEWVRETIRTTTDTITTSTSSSTTSQPDEFDYRNGTAETSQQTTTNNTTTLTRRSIATVENAYHSTQGTLYRDWLLGGATTTNSQLAYIPSQSVMAQTLYTTQTQARQAWINVPAIGGPGATRVLVTNSSGGTVYDNQNVVGPLSLQGIFNAYAIRVFKGGVEILNRTLYYNSFGGTYTEYHGTNGMIAVSGTDSNVQGINLYLGTGHSYAMTRLPENGSVWFAVTGVGNTNWQYNLLGSGGGLLGAVSGGALTDPSSRSFYHQQQTDVSYYRRYTNDPSLDTGQQQGAAQSVQQSNYLRQLMYSIVSGTTLSNQIHRTSAYNAFGEVLSETDGRQNVTQYQYNELGQVIRKQDPTVSHTGADGVKVNSFTPVTQYNVDQMGRTVASTDANNFVTKVAIRNGRMTAKFNPDGQIERHYYDMFGNEAASTAPEINLTTRYQYDKNNRLTRTDFAGGNYDIYEYDALGNRIAHTNGIANRETYKYDAEGRITRYRSAQGRQSSYSYAFQADIGTGGYRKITTDPLLNTQTDDVDMFGKIRRHVDLNGRVYTYNYNSAGWLLSQTSTAGQNIEYKYYANGYVREINDLGVNSYAQFAYDKDGNRTMETYSAQPLAAGSVTYGRAPYQMANATYDALNRVVTIEEQGKYKIEYEYDKVGNRRRVKSTYHDLLDNSQLVQDFWYKYDSLNRFTTTMGQLVNGQIVRGSTGYDITYNGANQRKTQLTTDSAGRTIKETYAYDDNAFLTTVRINPDAGNVTGDGAVRAQRVNNVVGDRTEYYEFNSAGVATSRHRYTYDRDHILTQDHDIDNNRGTNYQLLADGRTDRTTSYNNVDANAAIVTFVHTYEKWDSYKQDVTTVSGIATGVQGWRNGTSTFDYDVNGHLTRFYDHAENRTIQYMNNQNGQTLRREQWAGTNTTAHPDAIRQVYYLYGKPVGDQAMDGSETPSRVDYAQELRGSELEGNGNKRYIESKRFESMPALWQQWNVHYTSNGSAQELQHKDIGERVIPVTSADFDQNFQPINENFPPSTAGTYIVRTGDTLRTIAAAVWGDGSLWYLIAEANGLTGEETLVADMRLVLPNVVTNIHNNASTFRPVDPGVSLGDTSPTLPDPPPPPKANKGCGVLGTILVVVVAIVVTVFTAGVGTAAAGSGLGGIMTAGATTLGAGFSTTALVAGAVGAVASQGVAMALGMQKGFDWAGVAMGAIGSAIGAGIGKLASNVSSLSWLNSTSGLSGFGAQAVRGAIGNAATQGVSMAMGLQKQFSWSQVAASAVGAGVGNSVGNWLDTAIPSSVGQLAKSFATGFGSAAASAGVYEAITGERANYGLIAAQSFGSALGNSIVSEAVRREALWAQYRSEKALAGAGREGRIEYLMNSGMTQAEAAELVDSQEGAELFDYMGARTAGDRPIELTPLSQQLARLSEFTYGALHPERQTYAEVLSPATADGDMLGSVNVEAQALDEERMTMLDTVAGGIDVGSRGIKKLVDVVGGEKNAARVMTGASLLFGGPLKTAGGLILDEVTAVPTQLAQTWLGEQLYEHVFAGRGSDASARTVSEASAGVGVDSVVGMLTGRFDGAIDNATSYVKKSNDLHVAQSSMGFIGGGSRTATRHRTTTRVKVGKNQVEWVTDANGYPLQSSGTLRQYFKYADRSSAEVRAQKNAASRGGSDDHGGHVVGHRFVKDQGAKNLFPQNDQFNNSAFKTLENDYARWIDQGHRVEFKHVLGDFDPKTGRPGMIKVSYVVIDQRGKKVYSHSQRFENEATAQYQRQAW